MRRVPPHLNGLSGSLRETLRPPNQFSVVPGNRLAAPLRSAPSSHRREPPFSFRPSTTRGRIRWGDAQKRSAIAEHAEAERELALLALLEEGDWYEPSRMQAKVVQEAITRSRSKMRALSKLHKPMVASRAKSAAAEAAAEAAVAEAAAIAAAQRREEAEQERRRAKENPCVALLAMLTRCSPCICPCMASVTAF